MKLNTPWHTDDYWVLDADDNYIGLIIEMGGLDVVQEIINRVNAAKDE